VITVFITHELYGRLKSIAEARGETVDSLALKVLEKFVNEEEEEQSLIPSGVTENLSLGGSR
jgi:predicted transcriptional regulator